MEVKAIQTVCSKQRSSAPPPPGTRCKRPPKPPNKKTQSFGRIRYHDGSSAPATDRLVHPPVGHHTIPARWPFITTLNSWCHVLMSWLCWKSKASKRRPISFGNTPYNEAQSINAWWLLDGYRHDRTILFCHLPSKILGTQSLPESAGHAILHRVKQAR